MGEVGKVTYSRLEKDQNSDESAEVTYLILSLHRDNTTRYGLAYMPRMDVGPSEKICLAVDSVIPILSRLYKPFFKEYVCEDRTIVQRTIEEAIKKDSIKSYLKKPFSMTELLEKTRLVFS